MSEILVFGHKSPDTDSIMSSLVMADLEKYLGPDTAIACRLGEINKETAYALNYFKVGAPKYIESIEEGTPVILVDHNEFPQSVNGIEKAKNFIKLNKGDNIIITGGFPNTGTKVTNFMKIEEI